MRQEHGTRRGELLAALEHHCERPGYWLVEGHTIYRHPRYWRVKDAAGNRVTVREGSMMVSVWVTFTEALEVVADRVASKG